MNLGEAILKVSTQFSSLYSQKNTSYVAVRLLALIRTTTLAFFKVLDMVYTCLEVPDVAFSGHRKILGCPEAQLPPPDRTLAY